MKEKAESVAVTEAGAAKKVKTEVEVRAGTGEGASVGAVPGVPLRVQQGVVSMQPHIDDFLMQNSYNTMMDEPACFVSAVLQQKCAEVEESESNSAYIVSNLLLSRAVKAAAAAGEAGAFLMDDK